MSNQSFNWRRAIMIVAVAGLVVGPAISRADDVTNTNKPWERSLAIGFSIARGNTHSETLNSMLQGTKIWPKDELRLQLDGTYAVSSGKKSAETLHGSAQYGHLFTDRWYAGALAEGLHDGAADLAYRVTLSPNTGYYFIKSDLTKLSGETGPAFIIEKENGSATTEYVTLRLAERFERKLSETAKLWQTAEYLPRVDDFNDYLLNIEVGVEAAITKAFRVRVVGTDRYNSQPAPGRKYNDLLVVSAVAYKF